MVVTYNNNSSPMSLYGTLIQAELDAGYYSEPSGKGSVVPIFPLNQIVGMVPLFLCTSDECREGKYMADSIANDTQFVLPVFAVVSPTSVDYYKNDYNSFLFDFPQHTDITSSQLFYLDKLVNGAWVVQAALNNNTYGTYYDFGSLCESNSWHGFRIEWYKVISALGTGKYRFRCETLNFGSISTSYCTPPFCLSEWDCYAVDRTTKWEMIYSGGKFGNVSKKDGGGKYWIFSCTTTTQDASGNQIPQFKPIVWYDAIRMEGFFGYEDTDYEKTQIKYATGYVNKVRDEALLKFTWKSGNLPFWLHATMKVYGVFADTLLVSDYNLNNADYTLKRFPVMIDGSYNPEYAGRTRYTKVVADFKAQTQYLIRTRCCP